MLYFVIGCYQEEANRLPLTVEELNLEKQQRQMLQEESDLMLAKDAFGTCTSFILNLTSIWHWKMTNQIQEWVMPVL